MSRPLATGIDPLSIAARCPEVKLALRKGRALVDLLLKEEARVRLETAYALADFNAALAPFEGGKEGK